MPSRELSEVDLGRGSRDGPLAGLPGHPEGRGIRGEAREAAWEGDSGYGCERSSRGSGPLRPALRARRRPGSLRGRGRPRGLGRPEVSPESPDPPPPRVRLALLATHRLGCRRRRPGLLRPPPPPSPPLRPASSPPSSRTDHRRRHRRRRAASPRRASPPLAPPRRDRRAPALVDAAVTNRALANGRRGQPEGREVCAEKGWVPAERGAAGVEQGPRGPPLAPSDWSAAQLTGSRPCGVGWGKRRGARGVAMGNGPGGARDWASRPAGGSLARVYRSFATKSQFLILAFKARWSAWPASRALGLGPATPLLSRLRVDPRAAGVSDSPSQPSLSLLLLLLSRFSRVRLSATP